MLIISGKFTAEGTPRETVAALTGAMARATRQEEGCIEYAFYEDLETPGAYHIYEEWESEAALKAHGETPHMAEFRAELGKLDNVKIKVVRFDSDGPKPLG